MYRIALLITFLFTHGSTFLYGQERTVEGVLRDAMTQAPIAGAHVRAVHARHGAVSDAQGGFRLALGQGPMDTLHITHVSYAPLAHMVRWTATMNVLQLTMYPMAHAIPEVEVHGEQVEVVFAHPTLNVGDLVVGPDGLWVLVYDRPQLWHREDQAGLRELKGAQLYLLDTLFQERASAMLHERYRALHVDHRGRPVLEGATSAWVPHASSDAIHWETLPLTTLHKAILPWTDSVPGWLLGNDRRPDFPAFDHFAYDPSGDRTRLVCSVEDAHTLELFRAQYKYMDGRSKVVAMDLARELGVDREIIAGYMTGFHKDRYFHVPYAPLFVVKDTLCVFDHERGVIIRSTVADGVEEEVPIHYHEQRQWAGSVLFDRAHDAVYAVFRSGARTVLKRVDPRSGTLMESHTLHHPFPERLQVYGGHAYYTYRPQGGTTVRTLYRERL